MLRHYEMQFDGTLKLVRTEVARRPSGLNFKNLRERDVVDQCKAAIDRERFEALVDAACGDE